MRIAPGGNGLHGSWRKEGYSIIIQAWDFQPGSNFILEMDRAAKEAERTIAVLSPEFLKSIFTKPEWAAALVKDPTGKDRKLLPVRVKDCRPDGLLAALSYIDLVGLEEDAAKIALLGGTKNERAKPAKEPNFPGAIERQIQAAPRFPEALPPVWNVPFSRNPNFTGREQTLAELQAAFASSLQASMNQALWGMGGMGKTQVAAEYAYRHKAEYDVVWWLRSEEPATLSSDYAALAAELCLPEKSQKEQSEIVRAVRRWIEHNPGWLLIFDNAQHPGDLIDYLPRGGGGHVILTSRNPEWGSVAQKLEILVFDRLDSVEFLLNRTKQDDGNAADALADVLGDLPLALEQAGAYISKSAMHFSRYLELFRKHRMKILEKGEPTAYPATVATAWEISFVKIQQESPAAAELLKLCSYLAPDEIPKSILPEGAEYLPTALASAAKDDLQLEDTISVLRSYSLIGLVEGANAFSVHRLMQAVTQDRMSEDDKKSWADIAIAFMNNAYHFDENDLDTWEESRSLLPHALAAAGHAERLGVAPKETARLLNGAALFQQQRSELFGAKCNLERALEIYKTASGPEHAHVATALSNLGTVLRDLGDLEGAKKNLERALEIYQKVYGPDHPNVAIDLSNLGLVLRDLGDLKGAKQNCERALGIDQKVYGTDHPTTRAIRRNLESLYSGKEFS
jgi:tetratricopeptide (TPR) repeat protein